MTVISSMLVRKNLREWVISSRLGYFVDAGRKKSAKAIFNIDKIENQQFQKKVKNVPAKTENSLLVGLCDPFSYKRVRNLPTTWGWGGKNPNVIKMFVAIGSKYKIVDFSAKVLSDERLIPHLEPANVEDKLEGCKHWKNIVTTVLFAWGR